MSNPSVSPSALLFKLPSSSLTCPPWVSTPSDPRNAKTAARLQVALDGSERCLNIVNIYNRVLHDQENSDTVDFANLGKLLTNDGYDIVLGDFNLHFPGVSCLAHTVKGKRAQETSDIGTHLAGYGLSLMTGPLLPTFSLPGSEKREKGTEGSTIDLCYAGAILASAYERSDSGIVEDAGLPKGDHRPVLHLFRLADNVKEATREKMDWGNVDSGSLHSMAMIKLADDFKGDIQSMPETDRIPSIENNAVVLQEAVEVAIRLLVPRRKVRPIYTVYKTTTALHEALVNRQRALEAHFANPDDPALKESADSAFRRVEEVGRSNAVAWQKRKRRIFSRHQSPNKLLKMIKLGQIPVAPAHMADLKEHETDAEPKYMTDEQKAAHMHTVLWRHRGGELYLRAVTDGDRLRYNKYTPRQRTDIRFDCKVIPEQVAALIRQLKKNKAPGRSGICGRALRLLLRMDSMCESGAGADTGSGSPAQPQDAQPPFRRFIDYLAYHFTTCLENGYFPLAYKIARTIVLPKPKKNPALASSYRPIALLEIIGKLLEKIVAIRLTAMTKKYHDSMNLLPFHQFAFSGRSTEDALMYNFDFIYGNWAKGKVVTQVFLDFSNAYSEANNVATLEIMARKGLPDELLHFFSSYMCGMQTTLVLRGYESRSFGLPFCISQGSPLSSILWAYYTSVFLEYFNKTWRSDKDKKYGDADYAVFAFADDTSIIVASDNIERNKEIIKDIWDEFVKFFALPPDGLPILFEILDGQGGVARFPSFDMVGFNHLRINPTKTKICHFSRNRKHLKDTDKIPDIPGLTKEALVSGDPNDRKRHVKLLGIWIDPGLRFNIHIMHVSVPRQPQTPSHDVISLVRWGSRPAEILTRC